MWTAHTARRHRPERAARTTRHHARRCGNEVHARRCTRLTSHAARSDRQIESTVRPPILLCARAPMYRAGGLPTSSRLQARLEIKLASKRPDVKEGSTPHRNAALHRKSLCPPDGDCSPIAFSPSARHFARRVASTASLPLSLPSSLCDATLVFLQSRGKGGLLHDSAASQHRRRAEEVRGKNVRRQNLSRAVAAVARLRSESSPCAFSNPSSRRQATWQFLRYCSPAASICSRPLGHYLQAEGGVCAPQRHAQHNVSQPRL